MKKLLTILGFVGLGVSGASAQTTLNPGDIAFTGFSADNPDEFTFVLLRDLTAGTQVYFTDNGWDSTVQALNTTEGYFHWTTNVNLVTGTQITCEDVNSSGANYTCSIGETWNKPGGSMFFSSSGDQILAFQGDTLNPSFVGAVNFGSTNWKDDGTAVNSNTSYLPTGLVEGTSTVSVGNVDNGLYRGDSLNMLATLKADLFNSSNWTNSASRTNFDPSENGRQGFLEVSLTPQIRVYTSSYDYDFGTTMVNVATSSFSFVVGAQSLTANLVLTAPTGYEVREQNGTYGTSVSLTPSSGVVNPTTIEVRFNPSTGGVNQNMLNITSTNAFTNQIRLNGEGISQPQVGFIANSLTKNEEDGLFDIGVYIVNKGSNTVDVNLVPKTGADVTAIENAHFSFVNGPMTTFDANTADTLYITVQLIDDANSGPSIRRTRFGLNLVGADVASTNDSLSLNIYENDYDVRSIASIKQLDADFLPISNDSLFEVTGVVYGTNTRTSGYSFTIIDNTAGISNFAPASASTFGYTITEGDSIMMRGRLTHFNGLIQLDFLDTIELIQSGVALKEPAVITAMDESTENEFVRINNLVLGTPIPTWDAGTSGRNYWAFSTVSNDSFQIRILPTSTLANAAAPTGEFDVIGLGGQFDGSNPRDAGYQLLPRYITDILQDSLGAFDLVSPANNTTIQVQGDPAQEATISWTTAEAKLGVNPPMYSFMLDLPTGDFSNPLLSLPSDNSGMDTTLTISYKALADAFGANLTPGNSLSLLWTVKATSNDNMEMAASSYLITFERGILNTVVSMTPVLNLYPNPAKGSFSLDLNENGGTVSLINAAGQAVKQLNIESAKSQIDVSDLTNGVYFVKVEQNGKQSVSRLVISNR
ncbi:MAG: T9SS type A sorting domain-containing protein [Bacteroidetes bacterium]|nr:MAG: T9SS type A sorting domain-containing protein [Bacteroidota bacterium]